MQNPEKEIERLQGSIDNLKGMASGSKKALDEHITYLRARGANPRTIVKHLYCLKWFFSSLGGANAKNATRQDIEHAMAKVESSKLSSETRRNVRSITKAFYKHLVGEDLYYPKQVAWIKTSGIAPGRMLPEDILSEDEVLRMIESSGNVRDRAIIALLFDSGMRVGELLGLRIKDIDLKADPAHVVVKGKTGMRSIPILFSVPYIVSYLETVKGRKPTDLFLKSIGSWSNKKEPIERGAVAKVLVLAAERAHVAKRVNPHAFRHARATYYANRLTEQQLKVFFGWTGGSKMASTYVHLSGRDIDDAILQAYGKKPKEELAPKLTEKICPRCRYANGIDFLHCMRCGAPLDAGTVARAEEKGALVKEAIIESLSDPKMVDDIVKRYMEGRKKKGR